MTDTSRLRLNTLHKGQPPEPLLSIAELARLQRQTLLYRRHSRPPQRAVAGPAPSAMRGRGLEIEDVRGYQPGDDVRHMDWRATARAHRPITKVFRDERQRLLYLIVDRSPSMFFGTRGELKAATAARAAAILSYTALAQQDLVAGLVLDAAQVRAFPRSRQLAGVLKLLLAASAPPSRGLKEPAISLDTTLQQVDRAADRGSAVCLLSDFQRLSHEDLPRLRQLAEHFEFTAIQIVDPAEVSLPAAGRIRFVSPYSGETCIIDTDDAHLRQQYADACAQRAEEIRRLFLSAGVTHFRLYTHQDVFTQLGRHYEAR